nr:enoyl-CoA hydratase/isomerase family protein [Sphingomonadaceae bacterium]
FEDILAALEADGSDWATKELKTLRSKSPTACKVSLRLLREGATRKDFAGEMTLEYALTVHVTKRHDFVEGVRAMLIDRDNAPEWQPARAEQVSEAELDALFATLPPREAWTPLEETA